MEASVTKLLSDTVMVFFTVPPHAMKLSTKVSEAKGTCFGLASLASGWDAQRPWLFDTLTKAFSKNCFSSLCHGYWSVSN